MRTLTVNVDHVATLRQARGTNYPEVIVAAGLCELAGADGITMHLREDRRHIQDRDVRIIAQTINTKFNLEMAATDEMIGIALEIKPHMVTLVPEKRQELTTEGGLNLIDQFDPLKAQIKKLINAHIPVSVFVDPDEKNIEAAKELKAEFIEIHTGHYADYPLGKKKEEELIRIIKAARYAHNIGLKVNVGHGLNYHNVQPLVEVPEIEEFAIGHSIIAQALFIGLEAAVRDMVALVKSVPIE